MGYHSLPEHGKLRIRCFPISDELQCVIKERGINPLHELILPARKSLTKLAKHLEGKFNSAWPGCAVQLHYYGSQVAIDMNLSGWDLYTQEGEPRIFRVRYDALLKPLNEEVDCAEPHAPKNQTPGSIQVARTVASIASNRQAPRLLPDFTQVLAYVDDLAIL